MKTRPNPLGMTLFFVYLLFYAGFVLINATSPELMELTPIAGLNLAVLYGFALIVVAIVLSMLYGVLAGRRDAATQDTNDGGAK